jgi:diaminopimelate decarboxylase
MSTLQSIQMKSTESRQNGTKTNDLAHQKWIVASTAQVKANHEVLRYPKREIGQAVNHFPTPFFIYEEDRIRENCQRLKSAFAKYFANFTPLYAVKANSNPHLLKIIQDEGFGFDCSSPSELWIVNQINGWGMYTGNYTTLDEFRFAQQFAQFRLNLDDISGLETIRQVGIPEFLSFRINPDLSPANKLSCHIMAGEGAKYGVPWEQAVEAYSRAKRLGVKRFGIHMMTGSNILDEAYFSAITEKLFDIMGQIKNQLGIDFDYLNIGGGLGIPYHPSEPSLNLETIAANLKRVFEQKCQTYGLKEPALMVEPGRFISANAGYLVSKVQVIKAGYKTFVGIDAGSNDMPRPALYGAYHHISILNKETQPQTEKVNVVGRLCVNTDQLAKDRLLPNPSIDDVLIIHSVGGYGYVLGHNFNGRLRSAEYLITPDKEIKQIRRAETIEDLFQTVIY